MTIIRARHRVVMMIVTVLDQPQAVATTAIVVVHGQPLVVVTTATVDVLGRHRSVMAGVPGRHVTVMVMGAMVVVIRRATIPRTTGMDNQMPKHRLLPQKISLIVHQ
jgi:hypothetical protein